ncbi:hypothetical protein CDO73_07325 [Saccharibacillus sp. O23]|nr:hypothetical protein CDO73_07325 [Saccharibacillus sp. O23]
MTLLVDYCPKCGSIYQKNLRNLCSSCSADMDNSLNRCLDHLWMRPKSTTKDLQKATGVSLGELHAFIKSGRLSSLTYTNLTYPCESCGCDTRSGRLCSSCNGVFKEAGKSDKPQEPQRQLIVKTTAKVLYTSRNR